MKTMLAALSLLTALSTPAFAESLYGATASAPARVKVIDANGIPQEYVITADLNTVDVDTHYQMISLSQNGALAMCGDNLGQLAEDFSVSVKADDGTLKTATIRKAAPPAREVNVFGTCQGTTHILDQLQIVVEKGDGIEIR